MPCIRVKTAKQQKITSERLNNPIKQVNNKSRIRLMIQSELI